MSDGIIVCQKCKRYHHIDNICICQEELSGYGCMILEAVIPPPSDEACEMKEGAGFNCGYDRGHKQAKVQSALYGRKADAEIKMLKAKIAILEGIRDCYNEDKQESEG